MSQPSLKERFDSLKDKLLVFLRLQDIDENQSLSFLQRNYNVRASQIISVILLGLLLILLLIDGCNIIASIFCFVLPLSRCMEELSQEGKKVPSILKIPSASEQNSRFTDEEFSQIQSHSRSQIIEKYIVYFIIYITTQVATPLLSWLVGSIVWLILRCILTIAIYRDRSITVKILQWVNRNAESPLRRAELSEKQE